MKNTFDIIKITNEMAIPFIKNGHYSRSMPSTTTNSFGLIEKKRLKGVCLFGPGANRHNTSLGRFKMIELTRLVIEEGMPKNIASFFVSRCLNLLSSPLAIVSYADQNFGHIGYVYQATNWIYTGYGAVGIDIFVNDKKFHKKTLWDLYGTSSIEQIKIKFPNIKIEKKRSLGKHRYFHFLGNKNEKREMGEELQKKYKILPYPKGITKRHEPTGSVHPKNKNFFD